MNSLSKTICEIVAQELQIPIKLVRPDSQAEADLGIDSLAAVRIGIEIEQRFGIEMAEIPDVQKVQDLIDLVRDYQLSADGEIG